jgi:polar amino acid transport system substrate-binding protein
LWTVPVATSVVLAGCSTAEETPVADSVPDDIAEVGALVAATNPTFPPAEFRAPVEFRDVQRGEVTGFEVELLEAVADELGLDVEWSDVAFEQVLEDVSSGAVDVGAAAITVTDERRADTTFVTFFSTGTQWAVREPNAAGVTPNNACGARVAVQSGTVQAEDVAGRSAACESAGDDPIDIREFEGQDEVTAAVLSGVANAFVADAPAAAWAVQQSGGTPNAASTVNTGLLATVGQPYDTAPYGWAVADEQLGQALLDGLQTLVESGDYVDILETWGVEEGALAPDEIELLSSG